jgi:phosphoribosyl-AMP cyclohydrolase / phosphoribosyl-ATP pyrophosphohydrolase
MSPEKVVTSEKNVDTSRLDWAKGDGLLPVIVQHWKNGEVLMLGYMNPRALATTQATGHVTFFSRSKQRLWTKGESSGHLLVVRSIKVDCDADTLLISAEPLGPTCHEGSTSCFGATVRPPLGFLADLDALVASRHSDML